MKQLLKNGAKILFATMITGAMISCDKTAWNGPESMDQNSAKTTLFVMNLDDEVPVFRPVTADFSNATTATTTPTGSYRGNPKATGGFHYTSAVFGSTHFSIAATLHNNGNVTGTNTFENYLDGSQGNSDCLEVDDNAAVIGWTVTSVGDPSWEYLIGWSFYMYVRDNGEGSNADPDNLARLVYNAPPGGLYCGDIAPGTDFGYGHIWEYAVVDTFGTVGYFPLYEIDSGNIDVKD